MKPIKYTNLDGTVEWFTVEEWHKKYKPVDLDTPALGIPPNKSTLEKQTIRFCEECGSPFNRGPKAKYCKECAKQKLKGNRARYNEKQRLKKTK